MSWAWGGVLIGVVIVALAVGVPFFLTHRRMYEPHDVSSSHDYLRGRRRWARQRRLFLASQRAAAEGQPGATAEGTGATGADPRD